MQPEEIERRRQEWQQRREFNKVLERSSLRHDNLWVDCKECRQEQARDPYDKDRCVYGHEVPPPKPVSGEREVK